MCYLDGQPIVFGRTTKKKTVNNLAVPNGKQWEPEVAPACKRTVLVSYTRNEFVKD